VPDLEQRYQAISAHLQGARLPFTVAFAFQGRGIRVRGQWYPLVKMAWVEGLPLNEFVQGAAARPEVLAALARLWLRLAGKLRAARIAHGDLQHGNVLLVPGRKAQVVGLRLIDYDGMYVPALADCPSGEVGHPNYQHPERLREGIYHPEIDRFAHLVIYSALRCLAVGGPGLWERYDNGDNLLFREQDFQDPATSPLFQELWQLPDAAARALAGHLFLAARGPLEGVPLLQDLVAGSEVRPLTAAQQDQVEALLGDGASRLRPVPRREPRPPEHAPLAETPTPWWLAEPQASIPTLPDVPEWSGADPPSVRSRDRGNLPPANSELSNHGVGLGKFSPWDFMLWVVMFLGFIAWRIAIASGNWIGLWIALAVYVAILVFNCLRYNQDA
jgi:hypothetical protein